MKKLWFFVAVTLSACNNNVGGSYEPQQNLQQLADNFVQTYHAESGLSAISITAQCPMMNHNQAVTVFSGNLGNGAQYQETITNNDLWSIGSNSKAFTTIVLIKLAADSSYKFSLDDPIQKWLTPSNHPELQDILRYNPTVRQLLNMTSGIDDGNNSNSLTYWFDHPYTYKDPSFWISFANPESDVLPRTQWSYTDTNYQIADLLVQQIIYRATGDQSPNMLAKEIKTLILDPLNLTNTFYVFNLPTEVASRNRLVHSNFGWKNEILDLYDWSLSNNAGAGSILSTTEDMNTFYRELFTTNKILTESEFQEMTSLVDEANGKPVSSAAASTYGEAYGLGLIEDDLNKLTTTLGIKLVDYPNLQKNITNYNKLYMYPGSTTMLFVQIYNVQTGTSLMITYNTPSAPGLEKLVFPVLNYLDQACQ